jgi:hypothetical protein
LRRSAIAWFFDTSDEKVAEVLERAGLLAPLLRVAKLLERLLVRPR